MEGREYLAKVIAPTINAVKKLCDTGPSSSRQATILSKLIRETSASIGAQIAKHIFCVGLVCLLSPRGGFQVVNFAKVLPSVL